MKRNLIVILLLGAMIPFNAQTKKKMVKNKTNKVAVQNQKPAIDTVSVSTTETEANNTPAQSNNVAKVGELVAKKSGYITNRNSVFYKGMLGFFKGVYTNNNRIYLLFEFKNSSNLDYDIESIFFTTSPVGKRSDNLELEEKTFMPIWDNGVTKIQKKSWVKLVYAFDKFTLNDQKVLNLTMREKDGEREINLIITPKHIINAEYIKYQN